MAGNTRRGDIPKTFIDLWLFFLRQPGPLLATVFTLFSMIAFIYIEPGFLAVFFVVSKILLRSIYEWLSHRFVMHVSKVPFVILNIKNPIYIMHSKHHANPSDPKSVNFGALSAVALFIATFGIGVFFSLEAALAVTLASFSCLLLYEWFHLLSHSEVKPNSKMLKEIVARHRYHHNVDSNSCFSVSSIWADRFLGTDLPGEFADTKESLNVLRPGYANEESSEKLND